MGTLHWRRAAPSRNAGRALERSDPQPARCKSHLRLGASSKNCCYALQQLIRIVRERQVFSGFDNRFVLLPEGEYRRSRLAPEDLHELGFVSYWNRVAHDEEIESAALALGKCLREPQGGSNFIAAP